jgi:hypothetical protein
MTPKPVRRRGLRARSLLPIAAAAAAFVSLEPGAPALASSVLHPLASSRGALGRKALSRLRTAIPPIQTSTNFAGYAVGMSATHVTATTSFVVPTLKCTSASRAINASASINATVASSQTFSLAGMVLGCLRGQQVSYPSFTVNGTTYNYELEEAHPGDKIVVKASEGAKGTTVSLVDETHKRVSARRKGSAATQVTAAFLGNGGVLNSNSKLLGVPDFGTISFSNSTIGGKALGSFSSLVQYNRQTSKGTLQIQTGPLASDLESFQTVFEHH